MMTDDVRGGSESRSLYEAFTAAFQNEDYGALRALYAPTATMIGPAGNLLSGRDAILTFLQRAQRIQNVRFETSESRRHSDALMRDVGDLTLTVRGDGRETRDVPGKFVVLWTRTEGTWQIDTCVWSRQAPGQRGQGRAGGGGRMGDGGRGRQGGGGFGGGRAGRGRPGPDEGGSFNRRNMQRDGEVPFVSRID